jgi:hypothetical protein
MRHPFRRLLSCALLLAVTPAPGAPAAPALAPDDERLLEEVQRASFRFFDEQTHPVTGLVRDRARADGSPSEGKASIAASGFALSGWVIAVERGWVERPAALARVRRMLEFLADGAPRRHGFYYHFMEPATGARAWECEVSTIDTALFLAGALVAREYFQDPAITALVGRIYGAVEWPWFLNGGDTLALSWRDETGFSRYRWNKYSEHLVMSLLGMGSPAHPLPPGYWGRWSRRPLLTYAGRNFLEGGPLFIHQFSHAYVDFRERRDAFADYFRNSVLATLAQRQMCLDLQSEFPSWGAKLWGVTASDTARGYRAWGGPPRTRDGGALDGTIVPCAAAGSLPFTPRESLEVLHHLRGTYGDRIWRRYGFADAFNPETSWVGPDVIGIDVGITLVQAENLRTGLIQRHFMQAAEIRRALEFAGFRSTRRVLAAEERSALLAVARELRRSLAGVAFPPDSLGLGLTAAVGAHALGLADGAAVGSEVWAGLQAVPEFSDGASRSQYAAALLTVRQARPEFAAEATRALTSIEARPMPPVTDLGEAGRLGVFLAVAAGRRPDAAWAELRRKSAAVGSVHVLAPTTAADQALPGLWLDERGIVTGASAAQLAYARLADGAREDGLMGLALLLGHFPAEVAGRLPEFRPAGGWAGAPLRERAALLAALANLLADDCVRTWFQQDAAVQRGRRAIAEFGEAAFGARTSVVQRRELAGPASRPPVRRARAVAAARPRSQWDWQTVAGHEFIDTPADQRPGDPPVGMRFAFTWDEGRLRLHAEVTDAPPGFDFPPRRRRAVEWWIDPQHDGFDATVSRDLKFILPLAGQPVETMQHRSLTVEFQPTPHGYRMEAAVAWRDLDVTPATGLELGATVAVYAGGPLPALPVTRLNWRSAAEEDGRVVLGALVLE